MKLTKTQVKKIKEIYKEHKDERGIIIKLARQFKVNQATICYHVNTKYNEDHRRKVIENFRNKTNEEKSEIYRKRLPYLREYKRKSRHLNA